MEIKSTKYFRYPPNLYELDLATLVSMYRSRGEPVKADPGKYFGCALTHRVIKQAKWWFGVHYSQQGWDELLTQGSEGYPLTPVELNILGMAKMQDENDPYRRNDLEANSGVISQLAFMILNDLNQFGFLEEKETGLFFITPRGEEALHGICRRLYHKTFQPEMLEMEQSAFHTTPKSSGKPRRSASDPSQSRQTSLF